MLMTVTLPAGTVSIALDFNRKKWFVVAGETAWSGIGASQGTFELPGDVLWMMDPKLPATDTTIVIIHKGPQYETDGCSGTGRVYQPKLGSLKDLSIRWTAIMSPVRKAILEICRNNLPP